MNITIAHINSIVIYHNEPTVNIMDNIINIYDSRIHNVPKDHNV